MVIGVSWLAAGSRKSTRISPFISFVSPVTDVVELIEQADHVDVKDVVSDVPMREFIVGMFSYMPWWLKALYGIRWAFVRLLGMKQEGMPEDMGFTPESVSFVPGGQVGFFRVERAAEGHYWVADAADKHLIAYLGLIVEPEADGKNRYHLITIVDYLHWTGPVYFNVIRPFHHLVVAAMMRSAANRRPNLQPA